MTLVIANPGPLRAHTNLLVGLIASVALLAAAWLGQALAHTPQFNQMLWGHVGAVKAATASPVRLRLTRVSAPVAVSASPVEVAPPPQTFEQLAPQDAVALNAKTPFSTLPNPAAAPFTLDGASAEDRARALDCLTMAVYYEAGSQSDDGEAAVAQVVLNRLRHPLFPKTVCGVVLQGADLATGCQFTFSCDGSLARRPSADGWKRAQRIAQRALNGYVMKAVGEATHYHTIWVVPYWQPSVVKLTEIGAHIFYRWSGGMGRPVSFGGEYAGAEPTPPEIQGFTQSETVAVAAVVVKPPPAAPAPAPLIVAKAAPVAALAADAAPTELAQLQPTIEPQGYFGRPSQQLRRLPISRGW